MRQEVHAKMKREERFTVVGKVESRRSVRSQDSFDVYTYFTLRLGDGDSVDCWTDWHDVHEDVDPQDGDILALYGFILGGDTLVPLSMQMVRTPEEARRFLSRFPESRQLFDERTFQ